LWSHDGFEEVEQEEEGGYDNGNELDGGASSISIGTKVHFTNLRSAVSEKALRDVFDGVLKATIFYDKNGRSTGAGELSFARKNDAVNAVKKFNGVEFDGQAIQLTLFDNNNINNNNNVRRNSNNAGHDNRRQSTGLLIKASLSGSRSSPRGPRFATRGGLSRARGTTRRPFRSSRVTEEELDADLDDYSTVR